MDVKILRNTDGKLPILPIVILVLVLALAGTGFVLLKGGGKPKKDARPAPKALVMMPLEEFVVNLADTQDPHYLKLEINLGIAGEAPAGGGEGHGEGSADPRLPVIRDSIISTVAHYSYAQLLRPEGKERLKEDILKELEHADPTLEARKIYFTNFAMQ
ncbi:MAG: flagellar basal body-associated FliL family protein [Armatimonadetes bacterium]|nr:flagellar basal body-associated FliL family protein [Armatimonadota bacterium]